MDSAVHDTEFEIVKEGRVEWLAVPCFVCPILLYGDGGAGFSTDLVLYVALIRLSELPFAHSSRLGEWCDHWLWILKHEGKKNHRSL